MSESDELAAVRTEPRTSHDNNPQQLDRLLERVGQHVQTLSVTLRELEGLQRKLNTAQHDDKLRDLLHKKHQVMKELVSGAAEDVQRAASAGRRAERRRRLQAERLVCDFHDTLRPYAALQEQLRQHALRADTRAAGEGAGEQDDETSALLQAQAQAQVSALLTETSLQREREERVRQIETDVTDVNHIMEELVRLVNAQGETVDSVESAVESAGERVHEGTELLVKASGYQSRYRRKLCVLLVVALLAVIILTVILVRALR